MEIIIIIPRLLIKFNYNDLYFPNMNNLKFRQKVLQKLYCFY